MGLIHVLKPKCHLAVTSRHVTTRHAQHAFIKRTQHKCKCGAHSLAAKCSANVML